VPNTGGTGNSIQLVMGDLLVQTSGICGGEAVNEKGCVASRPRQRGRSDLASVKLPIPGQCGMTYLRGKRCIVVETGSARRRRLGSLVALALP
jgi:hypothetical protein